MGVGPVLLTAGFCEDWLRRDRGCVLLALLHKADGTMLGGFVLPTGQGITWDYCAKFQYPLHDAEGIMQGAVHFIQHVVVGAPEEHCAGLCMLAAADHHHLIICD